MFKNRIWLGIILSIILLVFTMPGFALYYKYTEESGANFYMSTADHAEALENWNEPRQIVDDLGNLLGHSKKDGSYPKDGTTGGTLAIPNSALVSFATGTKGDLFYCSATDTWSKLNIGTDNQVLVVATDVPNFETASSDLLSDVASIAMLDENEAITGAWTISTGSIAGIDATEFGYLDGVSSFGGSLIDDADASVARTTLGLVIGIDVLAQQTIGIADDNLLEIDDADATVDDYCKLTANGIVGRSYAEVKTDLGIDLSLYYLKTQIDTQGELEVIWRVTLATDSELDALTYSDVGAEQADAGLTSLAGLTYVSPSFIKVTAEDTYTIRTIAETKTDLSLNLVENTALSTWAGTESITTLGTITAGIWSGTALVIGKLPISTVADADVTHVPNCDNVYDFCETTQNYALNSELHNEVTLGTASGLSLSVQELSLAINSDTTAGAVTSGSGQDSKVWKTDASGVPGWRVDEGGVEASTFVALSDTPASYVEQGNKFVRVKGAEDGLEFAALAGGGDVMGPAFSVNHSIARFNGTDNKTIQDSDATIDDAGSINIPTAQHYKINDVNLAAADVGAIPDELDSVQASNIDWGGAADQVDTDDVPEGSSNLWQLTAEEVDDYVYALINDGDSVHTLITITYDDPNDAYDFVVDDDLHSYDWTNVVDGDIPDSITVTGYMQDEDINTFNELNSWVTDQTLIHSGVTTLSSLVSIGTISTGTWEGTAIADAYIPNTITINLATLATTLTITDNEATNEDNAILFTAGGAVEGGNLNIESDGTLTYNPSTGKITATGFIGALTGNADTCTTASAGDAAVDFFGAGVDAVTDATECTDLEGTLLSITTGTLNVVIPEDHITATMLIDDNAPADEDIYCYEETGPTGHWYSRAEVGIGVATSITDGLIIEADLNADEEPVNNDILTFDETGANFSWQTPSEIITAGTLIAWDTTTLNVAIPEDHINMTMLKDDNTPADGDIFTYELTGTTGHWMTKAELTIASSGANTDITSLTGLTTPLGPAYGGTGVANAAGETITLVGDDAITFTTSAATNVTLPIAGTLATLAGDEVFTNKDFSFYHALGSDHLYSGELDTQLVGESVVFGELLYFNWTDKEWKKTDADAAATMPGLRIALESKSDSQTCLMLVKGYIRDDDAFAFAGSMVYASVTPGDMSSTAPSASGDQVQRVGVAKSADILFFDPSIDVGEI